MKTIKKIVLTATLVFTVSIICMLSASAETYSGNCGDKGSNVKWTLDTSTGELKITGSGAIADYGYDNPWDWRYAQKLTIGNGITSIGKLAFNNCHSLKSVSIPYSVTSIGETAFFACKNLKQISISANVQKIGNLAFALCDNLTEFYVDSSNKYYCSDSYGVLFDNGKKKLIQYPAGNTRKSYSIPAGVQIIDEYAFQNSVIENITIPDGVKTISWWAFCRCQNLSSVFIPASVSNICDSAFESCKGLKDITIINSECSIYGSDTIYEGATIHGVSGSTAEQYATEYNRKFQKYICSIHEYDGPKWEWTGVTSAKAVFNCKICKEKVVINAAITNKIINNPTCTSSGKKAYTAKTVMNGKSYNDVQNMSIPKTAHSYSNEWTVDKNATCTETGSKSHHCVNCDAKADITAIAKISHTYGSWKTTKAATCTVEGTKTRTCTICSYKSTKAIAKLSHSYSSSWTVDKKATCKAAGSKSHHCTRCGAKTDVTSIAKTSHTYKNIITKANASTAQNGKITPTCSGCGKTKTATTIYYPKTLKLSYYSATYSGSALKPTVTVTNSNGNTISSGNYTVSYKNNNKIGTATVTVTFKGNYTGTKSATFSIKLGQVKNVSSYTYAQTRSHGIYFYWNPVPGATSYKVYYAGTNKLLYTGTITGTKLGAPGATKKVKVEVAAVANGKEGPRSKAVSINPI